MFPSGIWIIFALTIIFGGLNAVSVVKHHHDDEYLLEHRVIYQDAISKAKNLTLYPVGKDGKGTIPGCKACTSQEMMYCKDGSVIADHCCCDFSYNEVFPFVEHECRMGPEVCKVQAKDCAEYTRLRECCCHAHLASYWKYLAGDSSRMKISFTTIMTVLLMVKLFS